MKRRLRRQDLRNRTLQAITGDIFAFRGFPEKKMKKVVAAACLLLSTLCFASNWVKVGSGTDSRTFVDTQSIRAAGKGVTEAWVFWSYATPQTSRISSASPQYLSSK